MLRALVEQVLSRQPSKRPKIPADLATQPWPIDARHLVFEDATTAVQAADQLVPRPQPAVVAIRDLRNGERPALVPTLEARQRQRDHCRERRVRLRVRPVAAEVAVGVADVRLELGAALASVVKLDAVVQPPPRLGA